MSLLSHLPRFPSFAVTRTIAKPFLLSFHAFYEWTGEQKPRGRLGAHGLNDCPFQRVIRSPLPLVWLADELLQDMFWWLY